MAIFYLNRVVYYYVSQDCRRNYMITPASSRLPSLGILVVLMTFGILFRVPEVNSAEAKDASKTSLDNSEVRTPDPITYVLNKLNKYDLVMIGERHRVREEPVFIQNFLKQCYKEDAIDFLFLEFGEFQSQGKIESFFEAKKCNPKPIVELFQDPSIMGWGYREYFDIFKLVYDENKKRPEGARIKIVLVDGPPSKIYIERELYRCFDGSSLSEKEKWHKVSWLRDGIEDRDSFMAQVIAAYLLDGSGRKGIYYAGGHHIRKDLRKKDSGRRLFSTGGILTRKYPGKVCSLAFHKGHEWWKSKSDFNYLEELFKNHGKPFAVDTVNAKLAKLKMKSDVDENGVALKEAFDGYIMLNLNKNYHFCSLMPEVYTDEFAKEAWETLRKEGKLKSLPPELSQYKKKIPTGKELMELIKQGLR